MRLKASLKVGVKSITFEFNEYLLNKEQAGIYKGLISPNRFRFLNGQLLIKNTSKQEYM